MNMYKLTQLSVIAICLALAGCASTGAATPIGTQPPQSTIAEAATVGSTDTPGLATTLVPTMTPSQTPAPPQPTRTERPIATDIPLPTATSYPAPAVPLSLAGPWFVLKAKGYLWAMNQDGTGLTRLTDETVCTFALRPSGSVQGGFAIAYSTSLDGKCQSNYWEAHPGLLKVIFLPEKSVKTIVYSLSQWAEELTWSPSGNKLAFVGAMGDTRSNVFVYDFATEQAVRIAVTDNDDHIMSWSADERYVIHKTLIIGVMGFSSMTGVWSSMSDASGVMQLVGTLENQWIDNAVFLRWQSPTEIVVMLDQRLSEETTWNTDIRIINIETGAYTISIREPFLDIAYSPEHNMFLMTKESTPVPNRLLVLYQNGERREVAGYTMKTVRWLSAYDAFLGQTPDGLTYLISPDGTVTEIPTPKWETFDSRFINSHSVIVSPDSQWWAWFNRRWTTASAAFELWAGPARVQPAIPLASNMDMDPYYGTVRDDDVTWSPNSQYLSWATKEGLFVGSPPGFEAIKVMSSPSGASQMPDWRWSPDSRYLLVFSSQGIFAASAPDFKATLVADNIGWGGGFWVQ